MAVKISTRDQVKELSDKLENGMKDIYTSEKYMAYLKTMSKFHQYRHRNVMLIHMQMPNATKVAGFRAWQEKFGRKVKKGEKGIRIFAPMQFNKSEEIIKLDPETNAPLLNEDGNPIMEKAGDDKTTIYFKPVSVFDVSQTEGKPLPQLAENLTGDVMQYEAFMDALKHVSPLPIAIERLPQDTDGLCRFGKKIVVREGMSEVQTVSAAIHEVAHAVLHNKDNLTQDDKSEQKDEETQEIEAESVSYVVCQYYNIETSANSFGYLATWSKDKEQSELKSSMETIRETAAKLIEAIDEKFKQIIKERGIDLTADVPEHVDMQETELGQTISMPNEKEAMSSTMEHKSYLKFSELFPKIANSEYSYLRLEAGEGFEPLSLEWIDDDQISVMHTYIMNGDLMYDPMIVLKIDHEEKFLNALSFEQSLPPVYQKVFDDEDSPNLALQYELNEFMTYWLDNIGQQGYMPVLADMEINGEYTRVTFDKEGHIIMPKPEITLESSNNETASNLTDVENAILDHEGEAALNDMCETLPDSDYMTPNLSELKTDNDMEFPLPDPLISISERDLYGYTVADMLPLTQSKALELYDGDHTIYLLHEDNTESMAFERSEIEKHGGIFGIEMEEWETSQEFADMIAVVTNSEASKESALIYGKEDTFGIYQLKQSENLRDYQWEPMSRLQESGLSVERSNYDLIYIAALSVTDTLDGLYERFNIAHPAGFTGHSISISDVVTFQRNGIVTSYYVDDFGFKELPAFVEHEKMTKIAEAETEHFIANTRSSLTPNHSVAEFEAQVKAGQAISLTELATAISRERKPQESKAKTSILSELEEKKKVVNDQKSVPKRDDNRATLT